MCGGASIASFTSLPASMKILSCFRSGPIRPESSRTRRRWHCNLSDVLPSKVHITVPASWRHRRLRVPSGLVLHYDDIAAVDRVGFSAVQITTPIRTLKDCLEANVAPELMRQAIGQARRRGLISEEDGSELNASLDRKSESAR